MTTSVIVAGARTPIGKFSGALKDFSGSDLGAIAIKGALEKAGVDPAAVEYVIMGQVLTAGAGQMPARQASIAAWVRVRSSSIAQWRAMFSIITIASSTRMPMEKISANRLTRLIV